jgi:hypothetical protein
LVIFAACDGSYLDFAVPLIRSLDIFSPGFVFVLHLINPDDEDLKRVDELGQKLVNTRLALSCEVVTLPGATAEIWRSYYASARFLQLPCLLRELNLPVMCIDADSMVVNPIDFKFTEQEDADIVLFSSQLNHDVPEKRRIKNGTIWLRANDRIKALMSEVQRELNQVFTGRAAPWYIDQVVFGRKLLEHQKELIIGHIRPAYADWEFRGSSVVWTAKGQRKHSEVRFQVMKQMLSDRRHESMEGGLDSSQDKTQDKTDRPQVAIFLPRLDLPWKELSEDAAPPLIKKDTLSLRLYWKRFAIQLANALERHGVGVEVLEWPAWKIQPAAVDRLGFQLAFIPHRCHLDYSETGSTSIRYFMQEYFRWVFVVDPQGWSAASAAYPLDVQSLKPMQPGAFHAYRRKLRQGQLESKFAQRRSAYRLHLIASGQIPLGKYVFFPLQIPHDQSIRYFSDNTEEDVVRAVLEWSARSGVTVVFKPHPINKKSMAPFAEMAKSANAYWSTANIHDLVKHAAGVFTINSGVGFEALFQLKPVVTFGRAEYDCVCFKGKLENIADAWRYCLDTSPIQLERRYQVFVDWFLSSHAIDLSQPDLAAHRLEAIAKSVLLEIST